jgi:hypothetical protein
VLTWWIYLETYLVHIGVTTIPGPFTSSSIDGCLTFRFRSDGSVNNPGWVANVTCNPPPTCPKPVLLTATSVTQTSAILGWTEAGRAPRHVKHICSTWFCTSNRNNSRSCNYNPYNYKFTSGTAYTFYVDQFVLQ